jgi:hypothetical protein
MKTFLKVWLGIGLIAIGFGIAILILAVASGASWEDIPTYSVKDNYEGIDSIDFEIGYGEVNIVEGDTFSIDAENLLDDGFESYVSDGTWYIREDYDSNLNIFGSKFSLRHLIRWNNDFSPEITITIPNNYEAESFIISVGAGDVYVEAINAKNGDFSVDAGRLIIDELTVKEKSLYNIGTGEMQLKKISAKDITIDCGVGNVVIEGTITGDNDITCGIGRIVLDLTGDEDDYSYEISSGIGNVVINNKSYHNEDKKINNGTENNLELDCGIGNITVEFN